MSVDILLPAYFTLAGVDARPISDLGKYVQAKGYIILIETDEAIRRLVEAWLEEAGYWVVIADFDQRPRDAHPLLVIADFANPRSQKSLMLSLRNLYAAPVLAVSARFRRGVGQSAEAAQRLGVRKVLAKPFTRAELLHAVGESLAEDV